MRMLYVVTYDVGDDKRLRKIFKLLRGYGDHLQYSVFRCELSDRERAELLTRLSDVIKHTEDQVLLFPIGPADGRHALTVYHLGLTYKPSIHEARIF